MNPPTVSSRQIVTCGIPQRRSLGPGLVNATYRNIVGLNLLRAFGLRVVMCCNMLGVVGSSLKLVKFEPTTPNMSQQGGQAHAACCDQQCCDMLCWHVAIVWPGLNSINDLPNCSSVLTFRIFADDTNVCASAREAKSLEQLINTELKKVKL